MINQKASSSFLRFLFPMIFRQSSSKLLALLFCLTSRWEMSQSSMGSSLSLTDSSSLQSMSPWEPSSNSSHSRLPFSLRAMLSRSAMCPISQEDSFLACRPAVTEQPRLLSALPRIWLGRRHFSTSSLSSRFSSEREAMNSSLVERRSLACRSSSASLPFSSRSSYTAAASSLSGLEFLIGWGLAVCLLSCCWQNCASFFISASYFLSMASMLKRRWLCWVRSVRACSLLALSTFPYYWMISSRQCSFLDMKVSVQSRKLSFFKWSSLAQLNRDWRWAILWTVWSRLLTDSAEVTEFAGLLLRNWRKIYSPSAKCRAYAFRLGGSSKLREASYEYSLSFFEKFLLCACPCASLRSATKSSDSEALGLKRFLRVLGGCDWRSVKFSCNSCWHLWMVLSRSIPTAFSLLFLLLHCASMGFGLASRFTPYICDLSDSNSWQRVSISLLFCSFLMLLSSLRLLWLAFMVQQLMNKMGKVAFKTHLVVNESAVQSLSNPQEELRSIHSYFVMLTHIFHKNKLFMRKRKQTAALNRSDSKMPQRSLDKGNLQAVEQSFGILKKSGKANQCNIMAQGQSRYYRPYRAKNRSLNVTAKGLSTSVPNIQQEKEDGFEPIGQKYRECKASSPDERGALSKQRAQFATCINFYPKYERRGEGMRSTAIQLGKLRRERRTVLSTRRTTSQPNEAQSLRSSHKSHVSLATEASEVPSPW